MTCDYVDNGEKSITREGCSNMVSRGYMRAKLRAPTAKCYNFSIIKYEK